MNGEFNRAGAHLDTTTTRRGSAKRNAAFTLQHGAMPTTRQPEGCVPVVVSRCARVTAGFDSLLYIEVVGGKPIGIVMESILSILNGDLSIWGVIAMPVGVAICFGPALVVWLKDELRGQSEDNKEDPR